MLYKELQMEQHAAEKTVLRESLIKGETWLSEENKKRKKLIELQAFFQTHLKIARDP